MAHGNSPISKASAPAAALLAALLLTACSSPSPSILASQDEIATAYLRLVDASNADTCTFNAALSQTAPALDDLTAASAAYAESLVTLVDGLDALDWPSNIRDHADALIAELLMNHDIALDMAAAETLDDFITEDNRLIEANAASAVAANRIRDDLGLPSGGNPCVN